MNPWITENLAAERRRELARSAELHRRGAPRRREGQLSLKRVLLNRGSTYRASLGRVLIRAGSYLIGSPGDAAVLHRHAGPGQAAPGRETLVILGSKRSG
jgi:hypothetical protein